VGPNFTFARRSLLTSGAAALLGKRKAAAQQAQPAVQKIVYAWYPARYGTWNTTSIQWDALTHICFRSVTVRADGSLARPAGNPPRAFVDEAHDHGVKVTVLAWCDTQQDSDSYLARRAPEAAQSLVAYVQENGLDGVCWDDERPVANNAIAGGPNASLVSAFLQNLYQTLKAAGANYHLAYAAPPVISANDRFGASWLDWASIAPSVDAIIPMLYTANPASIGWTTGAEPLTGSTATARTVSRDVVTLMADYQAAVAGQRDKLLLGINSFPWTGYEFRSRTAARLSPIMKAGATRPYDFMEAQAALYGKRWDSKQQSAWYVYEDGEQFVQGWYDDEHSWAAKLDYASQEGLAGVGIWVLDGKSDSPAIWDLLRTAFSVPKAKIAE
jgi:hypothetical protein